MTSNEILIKIREPFHESYTLIISSEVNGVDLYMNSKVKLRYNFHVLNVDEEGVEIQLFLLDHQILEANNPLIKEVAQVSQVFGRMYNELHLLLEPSGKILKVLNYDLILSKWNETKAEMEQYISGNDDLKNAILVNDDLFTSPEKVKIAAQANEFFSAYFGHIFNTNLPGNKSIVGTNIFNTANLEWAIKMETNSSLADEIKTVKTTAIPKFPLTLGFYNAAYQSFSNKIKLENLQTTLIQKEERDVEFYNGKVRKALIEKHEIADQNKLYNKMKYSLLSDTEVKKQNRIEENQNKYSSSEMKENEVLLNTSNSVYKVVNGKEYTYEEWKEYEEEQWKIYQKNRK